MTKRIGIYLRVSTHLDPKGKVDVKRRTQDTEMQSREIQAFLKAKGWNTYQIFDDKGYTGTNTERPALQKLLKACRMGEIDTVVCYRLDRFSRSTKELLTTIDELNKLGVEFVSVKENLDIDSITGKLMLQILSAFSEFESNSIRERTISGLNNAKAKGVKLGRRYKVLSKEHLLELKAKYPTLVAMAKAAKVSVNTLKKSLVKQGLA